MEKQTHDRSATTGECITVLALHGYRQAEDALARPLGRLLKMRNGKPDIRVVYPVAPVAIVDADAGQPPEAKPLRAWWTRPTYDLNDRFDYKEFDRSCGAVEEALGGRTADVVVGFSQGAVMATLLLQNGNLPGCKCAVLFGASDVQDPALATLPAVRDVPALFFVGDKDSLCDMEDARRLGAAYADARYATHRWGHVVPSDSASRDVIAAFIAASCLAGTK